MCQIPQSESRWPHRLAVALVCITFPLILIGSAVTTTQAGMAVADWPNTYGYNLFLYPWQTWILGPWDIFIEHGHRLFATLVGVLTIAMVVSLWFAEKRVWVWRLGLVTLGAVLFQGVLGGMRVLLSARTLAMIHACVGPVFFALCVAMAIFTSERWKRGEPPQKHHGGLKLQRWALFATVLACIQLVLGAQVRHIAVGASPSSFRGLLIFHLFMAAILLIWIMFLVVLVLWRHRAERALAHPAMWLAGFMLVQIGLGAATYVVKFGWPPMLSEYSFAVGYTISASSFTQSAIVTAHVATGSFILVLSLLLTLRSWRLLVSEARDAKTARTRSHGSAATSQIYLFMKKVIPA